MPRALRPADIAELRAFCTAADLGSLGRAAVALRTSQPGVSKRLKSLEAVAGVELLRRSSRGVTLTPAGRRLYPEARRLLDQAEVVGDVLGGLNQEMEPLRLAVSHTIAEFLLPAELVAYERMAGVHPAVEIVAGNSVHVRRMVAEGRAELGIAALRLPDEREDGLEELPLIDDEIVVAVPQSHLWFQRETIPQAEFLRTRLIVRDPWAHSRRLVEQVLAAKRLRLHPALLETGSTGAAKREAHERSAPLLLSALALDEKRDTLYRRRIQGLRFPRRFVILARAFRDLRPVDRAFVDFLRRRELTVLPSAAPADSDES